MKGLLSKSLLLADKNLLSPFKQIPYLYNNGIEYISLIGGWNSYFSSHFWYTSSLKMTKNPNNISCSVSSKTKQFVSLCTDDKIDLSTYEKLKASGVVMTASGDASCILQITKENSGHYYSDSINVVMVTKRNTTGSIILEIDLSNINSSHYILVGFGCGNTTSNFNGYFDKVWLE